MLNVSFNLTESMVLDRRLAYVPFNSFITYEEAKADLNAIYRASSLWHIKFD